MTEAVAVRAVTPDAEAFAPFGTFLEAPLDVGGRMMFAEWLEPVAGRAPRYHLNRVAPSKLPVTVDLVERHPHAAQLFLPVGVSRYLVAVMPSDATGGPDAARARAFIVPGNIGVAYHPGTWHAGISVLEEEGSFAVMMWRGDGDDDDVFAAIEPIRIHASTDEGGADG